MSAIASVAAPSAGEPIDRILSRWLIGLRWAVLAILVAMVALGERLFLFHVRYELAVPVVAFVAVLNLVMHRRLLAGRSSQTEVAAGVALDVVAIAFVLAASGGAANPFSALFFVHVALAASLLPIRATFALAALAVAAFATLFLLPSGACCANHAADGTFSTHLYGMWAAFVLSAGLVTFFLTRVRSALDERERAIDRLARRSEEERRFAALGTLAAGTAHELATPLATVAVLAGEIAEGATDADLAKRHGSGILAQVARCRDVLAKMQAGAHRGAADGARVELGPALDEAVAIWRSAHPDAPLTVHNDAIGVVVPLSEREVETVLCSLLDNALHATRAAGSADPIAVSVERDGDGVVLRVDDAGVGVPDGLLGRLGEPFVSTKAPGEGMGLGLYLVRRLLEGVGGVLSVARRQPAGTRVQLRLGSALAREAT